MVRQSETAVEKNRLKYVEIVNWIQEQIAAGKFVPGQKLYSENKLTDMFHVSRQTVRHAISVLEKDGILDRKRGSGTYISNHIQRNHMDRKRISVVTTYVDGYIFPKVIQGIENALFENGYSVQIAFTNNQIGRERTILEDILRRDEIAGLIIETTKSGIPNPNLTLYEEFRKRGIPVIFINSYYPLLAMPHVSLNDKMAGVKATEHLLEMGHRKIGGIFKLDDGQGHMRYFGYLEALQKAGIEASDYDIVWIDTVSMNRLHECKSQILNRLKNCTALICYNDQVAMGVMDILKQENIRVPEDISIVSIDNSELTNAGEVRLTSVSHPMDKLGEKAAQNLLRMIGNPSYDGTYEFDAEIVYRESVRKRD